MFWRKNTTSFIIEVQTNEYTFGSEITTIDEIIPYEIKDGIIPFSITEFNRMIKPQISEVENKNNTLIHLENVIPLKKKDVDSLSNALMKSYSVNIENAIETQTKHLSDSVLLKNKVIENLNDNNGKYDLDIAHIRVDIARLEYEMAVIVSEIRTQGLKDFRLYQDDTISETFEKVNDDYLNSLITKSKMETEIRDLKRYIIELKDNFHKNRLKQIGYVDFIYFSFLTSASTNFGDIIPNTSSIRLIISFQILLSLIFLGILVNVLTNKILGNNIEGKE